MQWTSKLGPFEMLLNSDLVKAVFNVVRQRVDFSNLDLFNEDLFDFRPLLLLQIV